MSARLSVWMHGAQIGVLSRTRRRLWFQYADGLVGGTPLLSVSLPVQRATLQTPAVHAYFNGLLPEGQAREMLAYDFGRIDPGDVLAMLAALGRDCAGALVILPDGEEPATAGVPQAVSDEEIASRLRRLHIEPLGADERVRVSLAGMQAKLLACRSGERWALPVDGAPSTHILKPASAILSDSVRVEGLCLSIACEAGLPVASCEVIEVAGVAALAVERYDRELIDGQIVRIHQEDMCQALAVEPQAKYEDRGGPMLRRCAGVIRDWADPADLWPLLDLTVLNVAIGNPDAHGKNFSLLHSRDGRIRLAPAYDLISVLHDPRVSRHMGMSVNGQSDIGSVTQKDLAAEAGTWGLREPDVSERIGGLLERLPDAIDRAAERIRPDQQVVTFIHEQVRRIAA